MHGPRTDFKTLILDSKDSFDNFLVKAKAAGYWPKNDLLSKWPWMEKMMREGYRSLYNNYKHHAREPDKTHNAEHIAATEKKRLAEMSKTDAFLRKHGGLTMSPRAVAISVVLNFDVDGKPLFKCDAKWLNDHGHADVRNGEQLARVGEFKLEVAKLCKKDKSVEDSSIPIDTLIKLHTKYITR